MLLFVATNPRADNVAAASDLTLERSPPPRVTPPDAAALARGMDPVVAALAVAAVDATAPPARDNNELQSVAHRLLLAAASAEDTAPEMLGAIAARSGLHNATLRARAAANPATPEDALCDLAKGSRREQSAVASNPVATTKVLSALWSAWPDGLAESMAAGPELVDTAAMVVCHPAASEGIRREILLAATSDGAAVRDAVAADPSAPAAALTILGEHIAEDWSSRSLGSGDIDYALRVLRHPSCPPTLAECVENAAAGVSADARALVDAVAVGVPGHADVGTAETTIVEGQSPGAGLSGGFGL